MTKRRVIPIRAGRCNHRSRPCSRPGSRHGRRIP